MAQIIHSSSPVARPARLALPRVMAAAGQYGPGHCQGRCRVTTGVLASIALGVTVIRELRGTMWRVVCG
ncbi:MAG: hypothetical protein ACRDOD_03720 [Streptosporangiaceae bacterium]